MFKKIIADLNFDKNIKLPTIAVAMATYNGEKYVYEQLESIFKQTLLPNEIIISDDNSTDNTLKIINDFKHDFDKDNKIKIVTNKNGSGYVINFANACNYVNSGIIFFSDQDDVWDKNKIYLMTNIMIKYNLTALLSNMYYCRSDLTIDNFWKYANRRQCFNNDRKFNDNHMYLFDYDYVLTNVIGMQGCCMCFKKEIVKYFIKCLTITDKERYNAFGHDGIVFFISSIIGMTGYLNLPLTYRRHHDSQTCGKIFSSINKNSFLYKIFHRKKDLYYLVTNLKNIINIPSVKKYEIISYFSLPNFMNIINGYLCEIKLSLDPNKNKII